jgi:UDP-N-acetyl-D-galactosamine dehydrogenase
MNDGMGAYVAQETIKLMIQKDAKVKNSNILLLGVTFKENCPDIRNSKVIDVYSEFKKYNLNIDVYDPWANAAEVKHEFDIELCDEASLKTNYDAVVLTVSHDKFKNFDLDKHTSNPAVVFDVKSFFPTNKTDGTL